mgnify:CR=1 FL=1
MATGIELSIEQLKTARGHTKAKVTKKLNKLNEFLSANEKAELIQTGEIELDKILMEFDEAQAGYHKHLKGKQELKESEIDFKSVHELVGEVKEKIANYLANSGIPIDDNELPKIKTTDSKLG